MQDCLEIYAEKLLVGRGKTTKSNRHPNPTTNPNPNPYLVAARYGNLA